MNKLRLVKLLVFFLTFVLIFGMILAGQMIYRKVTATQRTSGTVTNLNLNQPKGSYLVDYRINDNIIVLHLKGGNTSERLISVDAKGKAVLATIELN